MVLSSIFELNAIFNASFFTFLGTLIAKDLWEGPKMTPPPFLKGDFTEPALALPVPFCLKSFFVLPFTIALVLHAAVPSRFAASWERTTW